MSFSIVVLALCLLVVLPFSALQLVEGGSSMELLSDRQKRGLPRVYLAQRLGNGTSANST